MLFGLIATPNRKQVTIFGDNVNLASRLVEEIADRDEIIVSSEIRNMVKENENFGYQPIKVTDRLKGEKIKSYEDIPLVFQIIDTRTL